MRGKKLAADALITVFVLMIILVSSRTETSVQPGDVAGALGRLTAFLLLLVGLFLSARWRIKLSGHNHKVGRQAIAAILFWYSLLAVLFGVLMPLLERSTSILVFGAAMVAIWSGSAYACRGWQRRLRAAEQSLARPPQS